MKKSGLIIIAVIMITMVLVILTQKWPDRVEGPEGEWLIEVAQERIGLPEDFDTETVILGRHSSGFGDYHSFVSLKADSSTLANYRDRLVSREGFVRYVNDGELQSTGFSITLTDGDQRGHLLPEGCRYDGDGYIYYKELPQSVSYYVWFSVGSLSIYTLKM